MADLIAKEYKRIEDIKHADKNGTEFWYARELAVCLEYAEWSNFSKVIDRAMLACKNNGFEIRDQFAEGGKLIEHGKGGNSGKARKVSSWNVCLRRPFYV